MGKLNAAQRKALPASEFAGPNRTYPIPDKAHAADAKARAAQQEKAGRITKAQENAIDAKANRVLGQSAKKTPAHKAH